MSFLATCVYLRGNLRARLATQRKSLRKFNLRSLATTFRSVCPGLNLNHITDNLTQHERQALRNLKKRQDIIIKPADKGSGTVVMDRTWYIDECNRQLNDPKFYKKQDGDITNLIQKRVTTYVQRMLKDGYIDEKTKQYLIQTNVKPGRFYILPKIHKTGNPGRPMVSSNGHPTERISQFIDFHINPLVASLDSHIKDTTDFLNKLANLAALPNNALLVTLDVSSLYTNIPHNEGIDACRRFLDTRTDKHIPTETLCDLLRIILTMNNFTFNQQNYLQIHGTAMGTKMAPSFANLFLGIFETNALSNAPFHPHIWWRYLDDIFMIWTEGLDHLKIFVDYLKNIHPTIKFTRRGALGFSVLRIWPIFGSVFRFSLSQIAVFRFWYFVRFADFLQFRLWFSVFVNNDGGFSDSSA